MFEDVTVACVCFSFPLFLSAIFCHKYLKFKLIKTILFGEVARKNSSRIKNYLSSLYFLSKYSSLALADWLLKCCFLSGELQNSTQARAMEITFLASLRGATKRPGVYFKCNWVWCVNKGKNGVLVTKMMHITSLLDMQPDFEHSYIHPVPKLTWSRLAVSYDWFCFIPACLRPSSFPLFLPNWGLQAVLALAHSITHDNRIWAHTPNWIFLLQPNDDEDLTQQKQLKLLFVTSS